MKARRAILMLALFWPLAVGASETKSEAEKQKKAEVSLAGKKAVMIIASQKFRDEELVEPKNILEKEGIKVTVASSSLKEAKGMLGAKVKPQKLIKDVKVKDYDLVVFVGGSGAKEYFNDKTAHKIAQDALREKKVLGAICIAPSILANAGVLKGLNATVYKSEKGNLEKQKAKYTGKPVEKAGNIITADGPKAAKEFGKALLDVLRAQVKAPKETAKPEGSATKN